MRRFRISPGPWTAAALFTIMLFGPRSTQAQVKLEYKFPEGEKLTYKTTVKTSQVLTLMGQGDRNRVEGDSGQLQCRW